MAEVWNADADNQVKVGDATKDVEGEVTPEDVKNAASDEGVKRFEVRRENGEEIGKDEFPVDENVVVEEYNENAA